MTDPRAAPPRRWGLLALGKALGLALLALLAAAGAWALFWTFYNPAVPLAPPVVVTKTPRRAGEVTVVLGGDTGPTDAAMALLRRHGYRYPYHATARILREADVSFLNLEAPVTASREPFALPRKYLYRVAPVATAAWQWLGLDLVSLANNHMLDYRARGLRDTVRHLDGAGIAHVGAGGDETAARRPVIFDVGGTKVGFLAYLEDWFGYNLYLRAYAVGGRPGCARFLREDVVKDVRRLRPLVDVLVVSVHWGWNYADVIPRQEQAAHLLASLGVDVVAGHHGHDVQAVERRGGTIILYGLGNYAWGTPGWAHLRVGLLARLRIAPRQGTRPGRLAGVELLPIVTQNRIVRFQPRRLRDGEVRWLDPLIRASRKRGTPLRRVGTTLRVPLPWEPPEADGAPSPASGHAARGSRER